MSDQKLGTVAHSMLKRFTGGPKDVQYFCTGNHQNLAPDVAQQHIDALRTAGLIRPISTRATSFCITEKGLSALLWHDRASAVKSQQIGRREDYVPSKWHVRQGADDHFQHTSVGMNAQIQINTGHDGASDRLAAKIAVLMGETA